ncbi:MAG: class I SAM-dependent methyltransferase [Pseudonocardiaceae bacterium]
MIDDDRPRGGPLDGSRGGSAGPTNLNPGLATYLLTHRDFMAPAVASLHLPAGARVLDAGTGAGGALPALARAATAVEGIDLNPAVVPIAAAHAQRSGVGERVTVRVGDLTEVLTEANADEPYDAIWASDVVWPGNFADPTATVADMAAALRPGGVIALFYSNYYRATFLPGHGRLERLILAASELRWKLPADGPRRHDRYLAWLLGAGFVDVRLAVLPRIGFPVDAVVRAYLESTVWPEHLASVRECGHLVGLGHADLDEVRVLLTPDSDRYVLDEPGYHVVLPAVLASGRRAP